ncbi:uncharacterized protein LOC116247368 isoform X3 [Nymphaea colorata]|uniref:uncharacterized protein LOC116247368 isoform X3 n=1 Tax=Nymphaea colorata TaxID=210225 RepID=UPI00129EC670|nr:uncharacterized protein LOC116247368 isoform X3 [Nymphaea colorata]
MTKNSERNPGSCRTMANSSKWRAAMERQEGPTNPGGTNLPVRADKCGGHRQDLCGCARPLFLGGAPPLMTPPATARRSPDAPRVDPTVILKEVHPPNPQWYDKLFAWAMEHLMEFHRKKISGYKEKLFNSLEGENKKVLELGIGTGPNIGYYANVPNVTVYGVDPNKQMEKYAKAAALRAGLPPSNFYFTQAAGEGLPAEDCSMDFVVGTLVLCSVKDVRATLEEVLRVLKPGGRFIFLEHVAALDGTPLRLLQGILNPLQKFFADGCHLNRETGKEISKAGFSDVDLNMSFVPGLALLSPHVYGVAIK